MPAIGLHGKVMRMVLLAQLSHKMGRQQLLVQNICGFLVPSDFLEGCSPWATSLWLMLTWSSLTLVLAIFPSSCISGVVCSPLRGWFCLSPPFFPSGSWTESSPVFNFFAVGLHAGPCGQVQLFPEVCPCFSTSAACKDSLLSAQCSLTHSHWLKLVHYNSQFICFLFQKPLLLH